MHASPLFWTSASQSSPASEKDVGVYTVSSNEYRVWQHLLGPYWRRSRMLRSGSTVAFNLQETRIVECLGFLTCQSEGVTFVDDAAGDSWSKETGTTWLDSADQRIYVSGRARQAIQAGDYVEIEWTGSGKLYVVYTGRTSGNFVNVTINGSTDLVDLPDDGSGNKYFDSYNSTDLTHKLKAVIAEDLPQGNYTVRLTVSSSKNANSSGGRFIFQALAWEAAPWEPETNAPQWESGHAYLDDELVQNEGKFYYAGAAGTSGSTAPTHSEGTESDGSLDWVFTSTSSYTLNDQALQSAGSQLEYAGIIKPSGASSGEDFGGAIHGNETFVSETFRVDGAETSRINFEWVHGRRVVASQALQVTHGEYEGAVIDVVLNHEFIPATLIIHWSMTFNVDTALGYFYPHMWPLSHWTTTTFQFGLESVSSPNGGEFLAEDYYDASNEFVGKSQDYVAYAHGTAMAPRGSNGEPSEIAAPLSFTASLMIDPNSVGRYANAGTLFCAQAMNISGVEPPGFSSMVCKLYFERNVTESPETIVAGTTLRGRAFYGLEVEEV